jgi:hypothetical protein
MCENNLSYADLIKLVTLVTASRDRELFGVDNDLCNRLERLLLNKIRLLSLIHPLYSGGCV